MGRILAIGDIKALLAMCVSRSKLNELLADAGLRLAIDNIARDGVAFDPYI